MFGVGLARGRRQAYGYGVGNYGLPGLASSLYTAYRNFRGPIRDGLRLQRALLGGSSRLRGRTGRSGVSKVSLGFKKRSSKFRKFRSKKRKMMRKGKRKSKAPAWATGSLGRYLSRSVVIRDSGTFNINRMGNNTQNLQSYYMTWCAYAQDLDNWLQNAYDAASITAIADNQAIYVYKLFKTFRLVNNSNQPCDVAVWPITPRREYSESYSSISGANPSIIQDNYTETKTTTLSWTDYGHDPKMSARLSTAFKVGKPKMKRLQPGDTMVFSLMGSPRVWAKILHGIGAAGSFNQDHTILKALSKTGCLIRARGTVVHNSSLVPDLSTGGSLANTDLGVATSGFNLDCTWNRQCWYKVPMPGISTVNHPYGNYSGYDSRTNNIMTAVNESRWADDAHNKYTTNA